MNQRPNQQPQAQGRNASGLLEELLNRPLSERHVALDNALTARIPKIEELLPDFMKGQGERLVKRAMVTFQRNKDLQSVPPADFVRCVLEAAEMGFAIDGKMCYVVKYGGSYQFQLDYKGIIAVARRMKTIVDIYGDVVCENDEFVHARKGGQSVLQHSYKLGQARGDVIGAYAVVKLPGGEWRTEVMGREALDKVQKRAPSQNGPWKSDPDEMRKKTVFRRCLKLYIDDPGLIQALGEDPEINDDEAPTQAATVEELRQRFTMATPASAPVRDMEPEAMSSEPPPDDHDRPQTTEEPCLDTIDGFRADLADCSSADLVDTCQNSWLPRCPNEPTRTVLLSECEAKRKSFSKGKAKQGQLV